MSSAEEEISAESAGVDDVPTFVDNDEETVDDAESKPALDKETNKDL